MKLCGKQISGLVFKNFYSNNLSNRIFTIFSIGKKQYAPFVDGILENTPPELSKYIGFDLSEESFSTAEKVFDKKNVEIFGGEKELHPQRPSLLLILFLSLLLLQIVEKKEAESRKFINGR